MRDAGRLVAAARMCVHETVHTLPDAGFFRGMEAASDGPIAALNRPVVDAGHQRRGISLALDQIRIRKAAELGCRSFWCIAPPIRWVPLQRQGFEMVAPVDLSDPPPWIEVMRRAGVPEIPRMVMVRPC